VSIVYLGREVGGSNLGGLFDGKNGNRVKMCKKTYKME
jgi:hypothetical protein